MIFLQVWEHFTLPCQARLNSQSSSQDTSESTDPKLCTNQTIGDAYGGSALSGVVHLARLQIQYKTFFTNISLS